MGSGISKISRIVRRIKTPSEAKEPSSEDKKTTGFFVNIYDDDASLTQDDLDVVDYYQEIYPMVKFNVFLDPTNPLDWDNSRVISSSVPPEVKSFPSAAVFHNRVPSKREILNLFKNDKIN